MEAAGLNRKARSDSRRSGVGGHQRFMLGRVGQATFVIEAWDSGAGAILGHAVDTRLAGDITFMGPQRPQNWGDFRDLARTRAKDGVSPVKVAVARP